MAASPGEDGTALQRVVVRLLHDPSLVDAVYAGADLPEIGPEAHAWIRAVDRRAWGVDPYRRGRLLHALIGEYPVAVAARGVAGLDPFFRSTRFHDAVQTRGHVALAFGDWLGDGAYARLERCFAAGRRGAVGRLVSGVGVVAVPRGTLDAWSAAREALGADAAASVAGGARVTEPVGGVEYVCVEASGKAGTVSRDLYEVLAAASRGEDPLRAARARGASRKAAAALIAELREDGLLAGAVTVAPAAPPPR